MSTQIHVTLPARGITALEAGRRAANVLGRSLVAQRSAREVKEAQAWAYRGRHRGQGQSMPAVRRRRQALSPHRLGEAIRAEVEFWRFMKATERELLLAAADLLDGVEA